MKTATTTSEQIELLEQRGMLIVDRKHAEEMLLSIGYYRLGFYWYPFEELPPYGERTHNFGRNTTWEKVEALYNFDDEFRSLLSMYIQVIETDIRTYLTYTVSNKYKADPTWFANNKYVSQTFIDSLPKIYKDTIQNEVIKAHHNKYHNDKYAPAWKTIEFFTFGNVLALYRSIKDVNVRRSIFIRYGINAEKTFLSYTETLRVVRNLCAHSHIVYDTKLRNGINTGPAHLLENEDSDIRGILKVIYYMLHRINPTKETKLRCSIKALVENSDYQIIKKRLNKITY